jgi:hypothetical protein
MQTVTTEWDDWRRVVWCDAVDQTVTELAEFRRSAAIFIYTFASVPRGSSDPLFAGLGEHEHEYGCVTSLVTKIRLHHHTYSTCLNIIKCTLIAKADKCPSLSPVMISKSTFDHILLCVSTNSAFKSSHFSIFLLNAHYLISGISVLC